jgi:hypothetical protein
VVNDAPLVETRGLTKRYGSITAVEELDLTVRRDEVYGFLGPQQGGQDHDAADAPDEAPGPDLAGLGLPGATLGVAVGHGHAPIAAEGAAGDLDAEGRLASLVLGSVHQLHHAPDVLLLEA